MAIRGQKRALLSPTMIRVARDLVGIDQTELAALAGVTQKTISVVERSTSARIDARRRLVLERIRRAFEAKYEMRFSFADEAEGEGVHLTNEANDLIG